MAKKNKKITTECPKCKCNSIHFTMSKPGEDGFSINFEKCINCGHVMNVDEIAEFLSSVGSIN